jgi:hypothetical protein
VLDNFKNGGKGKTIATLVYIIAITGFVLVKDIAVPIVNNFRGGEGSAIAQQVAINTKRLDLIEAFNINIGGKVDSLLAGQAARNEAISNLKDTLDRVEKKIDTHMGNK